VRDSRTGGLGFFIFRCFRFMRCDAGQGSGVEKNPKPVPRPALHSLAKIQTMPANINVKTGSSGAGRCGSCESVQFCTVLPTPTHRYCMGFESAKVGLRVMRGK
jgi:hypothetical protein